MRAEIVLLHPGPIPHPEIGSGSSLMLGLFLGVALTAAGWTAIDAIAERRAARKPRQVSSTVPVESRREQLVIGRPIRTACLDVAPSVGPNATLDESPGVDDHTPWLPAGGPLRLAVAVLGILMGLLLVEDVESTAALARFAGTEAARVAARSVYGFTVLIFVGAALAIIAPRAAAVLFGLAGLFGAFLGASGIWSDWFGGFDANLILGLWSDRLVWAAAAFFLALLAAAAVPRRRAGRRVVGWRQRAVSAPDRA